MRNYVTEPPAAPVPVTVRYRPPVDRRVIGARRAMSNRIRVTAAASPGVVELQLGPIDRFDMFLIDYEQIT